MALAPRDFPLTREEVAGWISEYKAVKKSKQSIREFLADKIETKEFSDTMVNTSGHDDLDNQTPILEMILKDLDSYA